MKKIFLVLTIIVLIFPTMKNINAITKKEDSIQTLENRIDNASEYEFNFKPIIVDNVKYLNGTYLVAENKTVGFEQTIMGPNDNVLDVIKQSHTWYAWDEKINPEFKIESIKLIIKLEEEEIYSQIVNSIDEFVVPDALSFQSNETYEFEYTNEYVEQSHQSFLNVSLTDGKNTEYLKLISEDIATARRIFEVSKEDILKILRDTSNYDSFISITLSGLYDEESDSYKNYWPTIYDLEDLEDKYTFIDLQESHNEWTEWTMPSVSIKVDRFDVDVENEIVLDNQFFVLDQNKYGWGFATSPDGFPQLDQLRPVKSGLDISVVRFISPVLEIDDIISKRIESKFNIGDNRWIKVNQFNPIKLEPTNDEEIKLLRFMVDNPNLFVGFKENTPTFPFIDMQDFYKKYSLQDIYSYSLAYNSDDDITYIYRHTATGAESGHDQVEVEVYKTLKGDYVTNSPELPTGTIPSVGADQDDGDLTPEVPDEKLPKEDLEKDNNEKESKGEGTVKTGVNNIVANSVYFYLATIVLMSGVVVLLVKKSRKESTYDK